MRRAFVWFFLLAAATAFADGEPLDVTPYLFVRDTDIHTTVELVDADTGFTPIAADTTIRVEWATKGRFDSLNVGNGGPSSAGVRGIYGLASTADSSASANFFRTGSVGFVAAVFGNGASARNTPLGREEDTEFALGTNRWVFAIWAAGMSPGNPGVGTVQSIWSHYASPDKIDLKYNSAGQVSLVATDDYGQTVDSVGIATDYYDSLYHFIVASRHSSTFRLQVDNGTVATTAVSAAAGALDGDTLKVFGTRADANKCRCRADAFKIAEDSTTINSETLLYTYRRGRVNLGLAATDTIRVRLAGIGTDSTYRDTTMKVADNAIATTSRRWHAFQSAVLDSEEVLPILIYTSATSPRSTKLDSIPAGLLRNDNATVFAGRRGMWMKSVTFTHESPTDTSLWSLRLYPSIEQSRDLTDGFDLLASARLHANQQEYTKQFGANGLLLPPGSFVSVYSRAASGSVRRVTGSAALEIDRTR